MQKQPVFKQFHVQPKNPKQDELLSAIRAKPLMVAVGPAGTGKTYCSASMVASLFGTGKYDKIIISRSNIPTGKSIGYFPGTLEEKMAPWVAPMTNVLKARFGEGQYQFLVSKGAISFQPIETIRGTSFENALILIDEIQNMDFELIKAVVTRLGDNSKMILMGDPTQSDIMDEGLERFISIVKKYDIDIPIIRFGIEDIVRSDMVAQLVRAFALEGNVKNLTPFSRVTKNEIRYQES